MKFEEAFEDPNYQSMKTVIDKLIKNEPVTEDLSFLKNMQLLQEFSASLKVRKDEINLETL